jgi:hypothetical protein
MSAAPWHLLKLPRPPAEVIAILMSSAAISIVIIRIVGITEHTMEIQGKLRAKHQSKASANEFQTQGAQSLHPFRY